MRTHPLALCATMLTACTSTAATRDGLWDAIGRLDHAIVAKDRGALDALIEPDFVGVIPSGQSFEKSAYIDQHCQPGVGLVAIEPAPAAEAHVRLWSDVAVVNRIVQATRKAPDGSLTTIWVFRLEAWRFDGGRWRLVSGQGTRRADDAAPPP